MKKLLLTSVAGIALIAAGSANAADLRAPVYKTPPPVAAPAPVFSWSGCFVGAHWGWGFGRKDVHETIIESEGNISSAASGRIDTSGPIFGGQVGCDYQFGFGKGFGGPVAFVIGIQGDVAAADINGFDAEPLAGLFGDRGFALRVKEEWISSVTGRIGLAYGQTLWYFKGGGAWTRDRWDLHSTEVAFGDEFPRQTRSGWTVGVGAEWAFLPNWSAFVEWDHYDFGRKNLAAFFDGDDTNFFDSKQRVETVKIGVNYRFNLFGIGKGKAPVVARY